MVLVLLALGINSFSLCDHSHDTKSYQSFRLLLTPAILHYDHMLEPWLMSYNIIPKFSSTIDLSQQPTIWSLPPFFSSMPHWWPLLLWISTMSLPHGLLITTMWNSTTYLSYQVISRLVNFLPFFPPTKYFLGLIINPWVYFLCRSLTLTSKSCQGHDLFGMSGLRSLLVCLISFPWSKSYWCLEYSHPIKLWLFFSTL